MDPRNSWLRLLLAVVALVCAFGAAGCGGARGGASLLDEAVRSISRSQAVDESTVRAALQRAASTEDEQLRLAEEWAAALPSNELPNLNTVLDDLARYGRHELESATCTALFEMARTGEVPSGQQFVETYLSDLATGNLPEAEVASLIQTFDELWNDAAAGSLDSTDLRLVLLEIQYC